MANVTIDPVVAYQAVQPAGQPTYEIQDIANNVIVAKTHTGIAQIVQSDSLPTGSYHVSGGITVDATNTLKIIWSNGTTAGTIAGELQPLIAAAQAGGGDVTVDVTISPAVAILPTDEILGGCFVVYQNSSVTRILVMVDATGTPINLLGRDIRFTASESTSLNIPVITADNFDVGNLTITGSSNNNINVTLLSTDTSVIQELAYAVWDVTDASPTDKGTPLALGTLDIRGISQLADG